MAKTSPLKIQMYQHIATHALVATIFTNPYFIYLLTDIYKLTFNDTSDAVINHSLVNAMSLVSFVALVTSVVSFGIYLNKKRK